MIYSRYLKDKQHSYTNRCLGNGIDPCKEGFLKTVKKSVLCHLYGMNKQKK